MGEEPPPKSDLVVGLVLEPPHLDPTQGAAAAIGEVVYANIFEGLTRIDEHGAVIPSLAESWDISNDGLVYTFHLRKNVFFHDGSRFDANAAQKALDQLRLKSGINPQKLLFEAVQSVRSLDNDTIEITLSQAVGRFLFNLGLPAAVIPSPKALSHKTNPSGTGAFLFSRWYRGDRIVLKKNRHYWGEEASLETVTFRFLSDPTAALAGLLSGALDVFPNYPAPEALIRIKDAPHLSVVVGATQGKTILALNNSHKPLNDIRVRRAIAHAVDRTSVIRDVMYGAAQPIGSHFSPVEKGYIDLTQAYPTDRKKARALLVDAGLSDLELTMVLPPPTYARRAGEVIALQLQDIGIKIIIEQVEWAEWLSRVFHNKNYDLTIIAHVEPFDLDIYARTNYYFGYNSERYQLLYNKLSQTMDRKEQLALIRKAQQVISDDCVNVFLFLLPKIGVWNSDLDGLWENSPIPATDVTKVRWRMGK